jgi:hypothetical protein
MARKCARVGEIAPAEILKREPTDCPCSHSLAINGNAWPDDTRLSDPELRFHVRRLRQIARRDAYQCSHPIFLLMKMRQSSLIITFRLRLSKEGPHMARLAVMGTDRETRALKIIIIFSGAGLFVSALLLAYALDLSRGLF